jgi:hypothetical protein
MHTGWPSKGRPLLEEQPRLDLGIDDDVPVTPVEIVQPRRARSRERGKISYHHRWLQGRIQERGAELVEKLIECALSGDLVAMKLCLERGWGVPVRSAVPIALQPTTNASEVRQAMHAVFDRVAAGELDLESAAQLIVSYRHLLATYDNMSVPMLPAANAGNAKEELGKRLARMLEAAKPQPEPVLAPEIGEEQLRALAEEIVAKKLKERGNGTA